MDFSLYSHRETCLSCGYKDCIKTYPEYAAPQSCGCTHCKCNPYKAKCGCTRKCTTCTCSCSKNHDKGALITGLAPPRCPCTLGLQIVKRIHTERTHPRCVYPEAFEGGGSGVKSKDILKAFDRVCGLCNTKVPKASGTTKCNECGGPVEVRRKGWDCEYCNYGQSPVCVEHKGPWL